MGRRVLRAGAQEQTRLRHFSRLHPGLTRRFTLLGVACFGTEDRQGGPRVQRRTARKPVPRACKRLKEGMQAHRQLPGTACFKGLKAWLRGHDRDDGVQGNAHARSRVCDWATTCAFNWLNRRGGEYHRGTGCGTPARPGLCGGAGPPAFLPQRPSLRMKSFIEQIQDDEIHTVLPGDALTPGSSDDPNGMDSAGR